MSDKYRWKVYIDDSDLSGTEKYSVYKAGYVGTSHKVARYPYTMRAAQGTNLGGSGSAYHYKDTFDSYLFPGNAYTLMVNRLISKFEGKCGISSALGSSIFAEGKESVKMAVERLEWAAKLVKAMRRRDIRRLKRAWGKRPKRATSAMKQAGGKWLEFSFGWGPLVQTVMSGMVATCSDYPPKRINVSVRETKELNWSNNVFRRETAGTQFIKLGYDVKVDNPNTWLLGRLDLLNPGMWIWEAIPYSFFVDYFINIGDMIHNLDSFAGLSFSNGYTTYEHEWVENMWRKTPPYNLAAWSTGKFIGRRAPLALRQRLTWQTNPLTSSWRRGLNASSFLAQRLR